MDPTTDTDYLAGTGAREAGHLVQARAHFEVAASRRNALAVFELCEVCFDLADMPAVKRYAEELETLAEESAEAAYVASKAYECGACFSIVDSNIAAMKRKAFLLKSAELGNPVAQIEVASNYVYGANNFEKDIQQFDGWLNLAAQALPKQASEFFVEVAATEFLPIPKWLVHLREDALDV